MQLDEFVKETLVQVVKGVEDASSEVKKYGGRVNPSDSTQVPSDYSLTGFREQSVRPARTNISFDIAIQVKDSSTSSANGGAKLSVFSLGASIKNQDESHVAHRVKFEVTVDLPTDQGTER